MAKYKITFDNLKDRIIHFIKGSGRKFKTAGEMIRNTINTWIKSYNNKS